MYQCLLLNILLSVAYSNLTITYQKLMSNQNSDVPIIMIHFSPFLDDQQYQYVMQNIHISSEENITFSNYTKNNESVESIQIGVYSYIPLPQATIQINFTKGSKLSQQKQQLIEFSPLITLSQMTTSTGIEQILNMKYTAQLMDSDYFRYISYLGFLSLISHCPQEIIQLQFLNYTTPINVFQFERALSYWTFDTHIPEWEEYPMNPRLKVFMNLDITDESLDQSFTLDRYSRISFYNCFLYNINMVGLIFAISLMITCGLKLIKTRRITDSKLQGLTNLKLFLDDDSLLSDPNSLLELQKTRTILVSLVQNENKFYSFGKYIVLQVFLEGKLCIFTNSMILTLYQPHMSTSLGITSYVIAIIFLLIYIVYHLSQMYFLNVEFMRRTIIASKIKKESNICSELLNEYDQYLKSEYRYYLGGKNLNTRVEFFSTFIFLTKKWIYAMILVFFYDKVIIQIYLLILLHFFFMVFKVVHHPYKMMLQNLLQILGDICFIVVLVLKFNDFNNTIIMMNSASHAEAQKWIEDGWSTVAFESMFLIFYTFWQLINIALTIKQSLMKNPLDPTTVKQPLPQAQNYQNQLQDKKPEIDHGDDYIKSQHQKNESPISEYELTQYNQQLPSNNSFELNKQTQQYNNQFTQQSNSRPYWQLLFYKRYMVEQIISSYELDNRRYQFDQLNKIGYYQRQCALLRSGLVPLKSYMNLRYQFQRNSSTKLNTKVYEFSAFLHGCFQFSFECAGPYSIDQILVGITQPHSTSVKFTEIEYNQENNNYEYFLNFGKINEDLFDRQLHVQIKSQVNEQSYIDVVLLSASDLLLFQPQKIHRELNHIDFRILHAIQVQGQQSKLSQFLNKNCAWVDDTQEIHLVRLDFPIFSSLEAKYLDILILFEKRQSLTQITFHAIEDHFHKILEAHGEQDILQHYITELTEELNEQ